MYRQQFHYSVDANNYSESFHSVLKKHYFTLRHDKSVFFLVKLLLECIFPDQERDYVMMTAKQTTPFQVPRSHLPAYLNNRPQSIINACLLSIEKAAGIDLSSIAEEDAVNGSYKVTSKTSTYMVKIKGGTCLCPYFLQRQIPCKHMFSIFKNFQWTWKDLPCSLIESPLSILF